jgi:hypothetical protein
MHHDVYGAANNVVLDTNALAGTDATHTAPSSRDSLDPDRNQERRRSLADQATAHCHKGTNTLMMCLCATAWPPNPEGNDETDVLTHDANKTAHHTADTPKPRHAMMVALQPMQERTRDRLAHHATHGADPIPRFNLIGRCPRPPTRRVGALSPCLSHIQQPPTLRCGRHLIATGNMVHASC